MQVHAIYENGRVTFQQPIRLKKKRIEVDITIPDNCIDNGLEVKQKNCDELDCSHGGESLLIDKNQHLTVSRVLPIRERLDAILGPLRGKLGSISPQEVKDIWHQHLEEKYLVSK
jgi:hypothetical protein